MKKREEMTAEDRAFNVRMNPENQIKWIRAIAETYGISAWERAFMNSLEGRLKCGLPLTDDQAVKLEQIYAERTK